LKWTDVSAVRTALILESVLASETSVNFNVTTQRYIPEDSKLHTRRRENLKSQMPAIYLKKNVWFNKPAEAGGDAVFLLLTGDKKWIVLNLVL
jgi:hypothetical protein